MHPETRLAPHHARAAELRAEANVYHLAAVARHHRDLRTVWAGPSWRSACG